MEAFAFHWETNLGDALVAAGTLALAGFTWRLARQTRSEVNVSREEIELTRQSIEAQDMPFVIATPQQRGWAIRWETMAGAATLAARLRNIGRGPAMVTDLRLTLDGQDALDPIEAEIPFPAGGEQKHTFSLLAPRPTDETGALSGVLRIYYTHSSGHEYMTSSDAQVTVDGLLCRNFRRAESDHCGRRRTR